MHALQRVGIAVPRQISVVGIDDGESCSCTMPRLSSVRRPLGIMGEEAARYIVQQAERRRAVGNALLAKEGRWLRRAQPTFIARESTLALSP